MQAYVCTILISVMALWLLPELLGLAIDPFELIVKSSYLNGDFPLWIIELFDNLKLAECNSWLTDWIKCPANTETFQNSWQDAPSGHASCCLPDGMAYRK
jgi:hypothetical protein